MLKINSLLLFRCRFLALLSIVLGMPVFSAETYMFSPDSLYASGLPVLFIETDGMALPTADPADPPEGCFGATIKNRISVSGRVYMVRAGNDTLYDSGAYLKSESGMSLRLRGNWSGRREKASYLVKLESKADVISGQERYRDRNWVLKFDQNMYPHVIPSLKVNELLGLPWTPRYVWVHLVLNGEYRGLYQLIESVHRNPDGRMDVGRNGYIIEYDAYWWNEDVWFETPLHVSVPYMNYTFKYPDPDDVMYHQYQYISDYMVQVEASIGDGTYKRYIDVETFARWLIGADLLGISDGAGFNIFLTKYDDSPETPVRMSHMWDFDTMMRHEGNWSRLHSFFYFPMLFSSPDKEFAERYVSIWEEEGGAVVDSTISYVMDYARSEEGRALAVSLALDHERWPIYSVRFYEYVDSVVNWLEERKAWMDREVGKMKATLKVDRTHTDVSGADAVLHYYDITGRRIYGLESRGIKLSRDGKVGIVF